MAKDTTGDGQRGTQTLSRGLAVLRLVGQGTGSASGIAAALDVPRSTAQRLLASLVAEGCLYRIPGKGYVLGPELIHLGARARAQQPVLALATPVLQRLAAATGDTVHLGVPDGDEVLYLDKIDGTRGLEMRSRPGQRMPLAFTGLGKALLCDTPDPELRALYDRSAPAQAALAGRVPPRPWEVFRDDMAETRARGHSLDLEENERGIRCVGAPVRDVEGRIVAGLSVASASPFLPDERMARLAPLVIAHADEISRELGWRPDDDR
ncbi:MAG: IclR family transcriptional regulator [Rhodobacteraceae bacterium]|nr:IclR family transcriptional regulator [Paracoccaceae bacterium]